MEDILQAVLSEAIPVLGILLTAMAAFLVRKLNQRWGLEINEKEQAALISRVRQGIAGAEEWGARKAGVELDPESANKGAKKAQWAMLFIQRQFPQLSEAEIVDLIDAQLASATGMGATGDFNAADESSKDLLPAAPE